MPVSLEVHLEAELSSKLINEFAIHETWQPKRREEEEEGMTG